jgi:LacI family transcriptional regulator
MGGTPTVKEVAARAGVSPSTVSNVFLGRVPVRDQTRRRVLSAARRLGYQPDGLAQALRSGHTRTLGLLVPHIVNPTIAAIVDGATRAAQGAGYAVSVCAIENSPRLQATYLQILRRERVAAVIAQPAGHDPAPYRLLQRGGAALVFVDRRPAELSADYLTPDYRSATREAVRHLLHSGRRRVALLAGADWIDSTRERVAGYQAAYTACGLPVDEALILTQERRRGASIAETIDGVLRQGEGERPDAIVAGSADTTLDTLAALHDRGVSIPAQVALVGTGDLPFARLAAPALSMIEIDGRALGRRAVELALERIREARPGGAVAERGGAPAREVLAPAGLVIRASSLQPAARRRARRPGPGAGAGIDRER